MRSPTTTPFTDIHCHLLPGIDDGAESNEESLEMARMAVADGIRTIVATPHQLGNFPQNRGDAIRDQTAQLQRLLDEHDIPLTVLPGGDVRIEPDMVGRLRRGDVMTLADQRKHVLLELPHEMFLPLGGVLKELHAAKMEGILSHPERNQGILRQPQLVVPLIEQGCLMQVTAGSVTGSFGPASQEMAERMLRQNQVHFIATDAHSPRSRRPVLSPAFKRVVELTNQETALALFCRNPANVATGQDVNIWPPKAERRGFSGWFGKRRAG